MEITNNIYVQKVSIYCMRQNSFKFLKILNFANNNNNNNNYNEKDNYTYFLNRIPIYIL